MASATQQFRTNFATGVAAAVIIGLLAWSLSQLINTPFPYNPSAQSIVLLGGVLAILSWFTRKSGEIAVGFMTLTGALLLVVFAFLPEWFVNLFAVVVDPALRVIGLETTLAQLINNSIGILVLTTVAVSIGIMAGLRITGRAKKPPIIVNRTLEQLGKYADAYAEIIQLVAFFGVVLVAIVFNQVGNFAAQTGEVIAQAPFVFTNLVTALVGFLTLGGSLPVIGQVPILGQLGPVGFVTLVLVLMLAAAAARRDTSGSLSQFVRRL